MPSLEKKWQPTSHNFKVRPPIKIKKPMFNSRIIFKDTLILVLLKKIKKEFCYVDYVLEIKKLGFKKINPQIHLVLICLI